MSLKRRTNTANVSKPIGLTTKIAIAAALCLAVQVIFAQAPPPSTDAVIREEVDAQGFKYQVPSESLRKKQSDVNNFRLMVRNVLTGQSPFADNRRNFRGFLQSYLFPMMTIEEGLKNAAKERQDLLRDLLSAKNQEAHKEAIDLTLRSMTMIVQDKAYRPAARYNAMLLISQLNDIEPNNINVPQTLPEPMQAALPVIIQQFENADTDEIKIAAMLGLSRHLEWDNYRPRPTITPQQRATIVKDLTTLAEDKDPPPTRDAEVHSWMRRRAIEGLTMACITKPDAEIAATMDRMLKDEANPMNVRLAVATALGRMSLQAPVKIDAVATAKDLGYLALVACDAELTRAEAQRKADYEHFARLMGTYSGESEYSTGLSGGMPGGMPGGGRMPGMPGPGGLSGMGGLSGEGGINRARPNPGLSGETGGYGNETNLLNPAEADPKHYQMEYLRRRIRQQLYAVQLGLLGGDDHAPPKDRVGPPAPLNPNSASASGSGNTPPGEKKGLFAVAKPNEKEQVDQVYFKVRKLAEVVEQAGESEFHQFIKDMRKELPRLEMVVGRRLAPAAAAGAAAPDVDAPAAGPASKMGPGKGLPGKGPAVPGKAAPAPGKSAARPQPQVFGRPR